MAKKVGVTRNRYGEFERDQETETAAKLWIPFLDKLTAEEKCFILRRRKGKTQEECATELGVTRFWYNQMEMGKVPNKDLLKLWGASE